MAASSVQLMLLQSHHQNLPFRVKATLSTDESPDWSFGKVAVQQLGGEGREETGGGGAAGARCRTRDIPRVWTRSSAIVTCQRAGEVQRGFLAFGLSDPHMGAPHWKRSFKYHIHRHLIYANQPTCSIQSDDIFSC